MYKNKKYFSSLYFLSSIVYFLVLYFVAFIIELISLVRVGSSQISSFFLAFIGGTLNPLIIVLLLFLFVSSIFLKKVSDEKNSKILLRVTTILFVAATISMFYSSISLFSNGINLLSRNSTDYGTVDLIFGLIGIGTTLAFAIINYLKARNDFIYFIFNIEKSNSKEIKKSKEEQK